MKISNSKKQLARIISENGGWRDVAEWAAQDEAVAFFSGGKPEYATQDKVWCANGDNGSYICAMGADDKIKCFHNTILSRDEYFHLYPAPDADGWIEWEGGECPVNGDELVVCKVRSGREWRDGKAIKAKVLRWRHTGGIADIIAYRPHKPEQAKPKPVKAVEAKPTIEQLAADYRNAKDYAERKQEEADAAKADADARLKSLELAGEAIELLVSPINANQESELDIEVKVGDEVECVEPNVFREKYRGMIGTILDVDVDDASTPYLVDFGGEAKIWCHKVKFIRRP